jgi:hypothetical protein
MQSNNKFMIHTTYQPSRVKGPLEGLYVRCSRFNPRRSDLVPTLLFSSHP